MFECSPKKFYRLKLPLKNGGDDRDDGRRGDESKGELYNPLGGLSIFNKFLVEFSVSVTACSIFVLSVSTSVDSPSSRSMTCCWKSWSNIRVN